MNGAVLYLDDGPQLFKGVATTHLQGRTRRSQRELLKAGGMAGSSSTQQTPGLHFTKQGPLA